MLAELRRRPARTVAAVLSLAVGVALFISLQAYGAGYRRAARVPLAEIGSDIVAQRQGARPEGFEGIVFPHSTAPIHPEEVARIRTVPGVEAAAEALFFWSFEGDQFLVGLGVDPTQEVGPGRLRAGLRAGRFLRAGDHDVAVADTSYASENGLTLGGEVVLAGHRYQVVGLVDTSRAGQVANANVYLPLTDVQPLVAAAPNVRAVHDIGPGDANVLFVRAEAARGPDVARRVEDVLGADAIVTTPRSFDEVFGPAFALVDRFGAVVGIVGLLVAAAAFLRAGVASLVERRQDVALLTAIGWRRRDVAAQLTAETLITGALGAVTGVLLAIAVASMLSMSHVTIPVPWELSPTPHFLPGGAKELAVTVTLPARVAPRAVAGSLGLSLLVAGAVAAWLARRSAAIKPAEAWRGE